MSQTLRQAAYEQMLYEHRRTIHCTVGDILQLHNSDRKDPRVLRLTAHHYYKARDAARAVPMLVAAGEDAIARGNSTVAYKCFDRLLRISGNMYVDPVANSIVVRKPWSDQDRENQNQKKEEKEEKKEKNELQTVVVFVEGVENGTLTLPSQMVDLYKRKMDRFVQTTKMAARLLSVVGVSLTLNDVIDMNEKINLVTMPGKYNTKSEMESGASRIWKHCS